MKYLFCFLLTILFGCSEDYVKKDPLLCTLPPTAYSPYLYTAHEVYQEPVMDGKALEKSWQLVRWNPSYADSNFQYKILWYYDAVYLLTKYPLKQYKISNKKNIEISVFQNDTLLYCRQNDLRKERGYEYSVGEDESNLTTEIRLSNIIHEDSLLLNRKGVAISFSCLVNQKEKIRLDFVR